MKHDPQTDEHQTLEDLLPNSDDIARALDRDAADETLRRFLEHAAQNPRLAQAVADFNQARDAASPSPQGPAQGPAQGPPPLPAPAPTPHDTLPSVGTLHSAANAPIAQGFGTPGKPGSSGKGDTLRMLHAGGTSPEAVALAAHTPTHTPAPYVPNYSATPFRAPAPPAAPTPAAAPTLRDGARQHGDSFDPPPPKVTRPSDTPGIDALRALNEADDRERELRRLERKKLQDHKNARSAEIAAREAAAAAAKALAAASNGAASGSATQNALGPKASSSPSPSPSPSPSSGKDPGKEHASRWQANGLAAIPIDKAALPSAHAPTPSPAPGTAPTTTSQPKSDRRTTAASGNYPRRRVVALALVSVVLPVLVWMLLSQLMSTEPQGPSGPAAGDRSRGVEVEGSEAPPVAGTLGAPAATAEPPITRAPVPSHTEASDLPTSPTVSRPNISAPSIPSAPPPSSSPPSKAPSPPNAPAPSPTRTAPDRTPEPPPEGPAKSAPQPDPAQPPDAPPPFYPVAPF
jgi:hypothetical protein